KKMFGGVAFLLNGNMACGVQGDVLIVRVGPEGYADAIAQPYTRPFDMTGRPMSGWIVVDPPGYRTQEDLRAWLQKGIGFALSLPQK
ncbi:MAG: TfoX/Sxy family protein, partial [Anaerolineaceae bacterium]|nr:TfoX/Sxy family protein [Anaerolineaceae bacterium]